MNIKLPPPPREKTSEIQESQWREALFRFVHPQRSTSGDADATIPAASTYHGVTALTSARTLTLPSADSYLEGLDLVVQDEAGAAGTHTITIQASGSDTVNGGASIDITSDHGRLTFHRSGPGKWFAA